QFHSFDEPSFTSIYFVGPKNATNKFIRHLDKRCKAPYYRVYVHNLAFDLVEFFWQGKEKLITADGACEFTIGAWTISGVYGRPPFCRLRREKPRCTVELVDSYLWFKTSLAHAAAVHCPDWPKLPRLDGIGSKRFTKSDPFFIEYAMRDAEVCAHLGQLIEDMHTHFQIAPTISLASMAANIFTTHFVTRTIHQPNDRIMRAAVATYHGGKNNVRPNAAPAWHQGVNAYDLSSAYPFAMSELPGFTDETGYFETSYPANVKAVPPVGLYCISGTADSCQWPALFDHSFNPLKGEFEHVWVHGSELNSALDTDEIKIRSRFPAIV